MDPGRDSPTGGDSTQRRSAPKGAAPRRNPQRREAVGCAPRRRQRRMAAAAPVRIHGHLPRTSTAASATLSTARMPAPHPAVVTPATSGYLRRRRFHARAEHPSRESPPPPTGRWHEARRKRRPWDRSAGARSDVVFASSDASTSSDEASHKPVERVRTARDRPTVGSAGGRHRSNSAHIWWRRSTGHQLRPLADETVLSVGPRDDHRFTAAPWGRSTSTLAQTRRNADRARALEAERITLLGPSRSVRAGDAVPDRRRVEARPSPALRCSRTGGGLSSRSSADGGPTGSRRDLVVDFGGSSILCVAPCAPACGGTPASGRVD
jgi:hypothetical protein